MSSSTIDGLLGAVWPAIRQDLGLSYAQIGLLMGIPGIIGSLAETPLGIAADVWSRRLFVAGGGAAFALALCLVGAAPAFVALLAGLILSSPASGAFVSLSQATLMDLAPDRREYNMARWALAGSLGNLGGPMLAGAALAASQAGVPCSSDWPYWPGSLPG